MRERTSLLYRQHMRPRGHHCDRTCFVSALPCLMSLLILFDGLLIIKSTGNILHSKWQAVETIQSASFRALIFPTSPVHTRARYQAGCVLCRRDRHETGLLIYGRTNPSLTMSRVQIKWRLEIFVWSTCAYFLNLAAL